MRLSVLLTSLFLGLALLSGCGGGSSGGSGGSGDGGSGGSGGSGDGGSGGSGGSGKNALEGTWKKLCGPVDPDAYDLPLYDVLTVTYTATKYDVDHKLYLDSECTPAKLLVHNPSANGTYTLGDTATTLGGVTATKADFHLTESNGTPANVYEFTIIYIDGGSFYLGKVGVGYEADTEAGRPITLDYDRQYLRQ